MNRRIRSLTKTGSSSSSSSSSSTKRDEGGFYRYLKPGALAQLRNSKIRSHQKHQISLYRVESVTTPSSTNVVHQSQIATIEGFPCFTGRIYSSPRCPQRKKLVGARSIFFLSSSSSPSSPTVADTPTPLMDVINTTDILVSH